jgi:riboflavin synthase
MFTGLIEEVGAIKSIQQTGNNHRIIISAPRLTSRLKSGDSISVNGVCLTALDITLGSFAADLAAETVAHTSLLKISPGASVNLELPIPAGAPLGGHIVQGHVDGVASITQFRRNTNADDWQLTFTLPPALSSYVVQRGSIAVEGISLTVAQINGDEVTIAIIPHTYEATNLRTLKAGDLINIEVDVLAKYAQKREAASSLTVDEVIRQGF